MEQLYQSRLLYLLNVDDRAKSIATDFVNSKPISVEILKSVIELYQSAKVEQHFKDEFFENAYHSPITGELEFLIARILYHYSQLKNKQWKILLRKQESHTAPDIRLLHKGKTFAIIEVKAKAGWIQPFLSPERYIYDKKRLTDGKTIFDPANLVATSRNQLTKYFTTFNLTNKDVFLFLPTLALVHRKKYRTELDGYYEYFASTSQLPQENLILLSANKRLDLSNATSKLEPTDNFEKMMIKLSNRTFT
jgi:hypothetical protein